MNDENSSFTVSPTSSDHRVKLNVGGKIFETTASTLQSGGSDSLLSLLSIRPNYDSNPIFIDRDPEIFSVLLSLLRSNALPSTSRRFTKQELLEEALYYGIESQLSKASLPPPLLGFDASVSTIVTPASDGIPSVFSAANDDGSIWIAHAGQISAYDWNLIHSGTVRTHLEDICCLRCIWPEIASVGSETEPGLHFYDVFSGKRVGSVHWSDATDPRIYKARVNAISDSSNSVFASFECPHRENSVLVIDKNTMQIVSEIGRQSGNSSKTMVPSKLRYVPQSNLLFGCSINSGAFGYSGYIRLWDVRSGDVIWETNEPGSGRSSRFGDSLADSDIDSDGLAIFKVCSKSGDLARADLNRLNEDPWIYLEERNPSLRMTGSGEESILHCYKGQVFVGRSGNLEVWSKILSENLPCNGEYRRNFVDKEEDGKRGIIRRIEGGGNRLFVSREGAEGVEVWESSNVVGKN